MIQLIKNISRKLLILILIGIIQYSFEKSTLEYKYIISNQICNSGTDIGYYHYLFNITAKLSGNLSKSYIDNFKIETNDNNPNVVVECNFPEKNSGNETIEVNIPCYIENHFHGIYYILSFKGESNELQLINFGHIFLGRIYCMREIVLDLGEIKDQICDFSQSYPKLKFKIDILNNPIIPEDLKHHSMNLNFASEREESEKSSYCFIKNNNSNLIYLDCIMEFYRALDNSLYLEKDDSQSQDDIVNNITYVIFKNKDKKYIGNNTFCPDKYNINYLDIFKGFCKNGAFYFSIDFEDFIDDKEDRNEMIKSRKLLIELKGKVDSKSSKNFCYLENKNEKDKYDLSKYKLNCVVPTVEDMDNRL